MHDFALWRVEALALPALRAHCARCARLSAFLCTERFRVNANGGRLDVWLLYRCASCAEVQKRRVLTRARVSEVPAEELSGYQADAPEWVRRWAFAGTSGAEVPYRVARPPLPASGELRARIVQPEPCGARWDRFLARELGWSRTRLARAELRGLVRIAPAKSSARAVADGDSVELSLSAPT